MIVETPKSAGVFPVGFTPVCDVDAGRFFVLEDVAYDKRNAPMLGAGSQEFADGQSEFSSGVDVSPEVGFGAACSRSCRR